MYKKLFMVLNDICPKKARKQKIKANTWYTKDHKKLAKKVKKAFKRGKRNLGKSWVYYKKIRRYAEKAGRHHGRNIKKQDKP